MSPKPPVLKAREVIQLLERRGFAEIRQRGSHKQFRHADGRQTRVPVHAGRDIALPLLRQIARDIGLTIDESSEAMTSHVASSKRPTYASAAGVRDWT